MAAILLSSTEFARQLEEVGMPRKQAEVVAHGVTGMFVHNFDALVTKDFLDTRFSEFEARLGREMDARFTEVEQRFTATQSQMDQRFVEQQNRMNLGFAAVDTRFARINVMLAVILAGVAVPVIQSLASLIVS